MLIISRLQTTKAPLSGLAVKEGARRDDILALSIHDTEEADLRKKIFRERVQSEFAFQSYVLALASVWHLS